MFAARLFRINDEVKLHMYCVLQLEDTEILQIALLRRTLVFFLSNLVFTGKNLLLRFLTEGAGWRRLSCIIAAAAENSRRLAR